MLEFTLHTEPRYYAWLHLIHWIMNKMQGDSYNLAVCDYFNAWSYQYWSFIFMYKSLFLLDKCWGYWQDESRTQGHSDSSSTCEARPICSRIPRCHGGKYRCQPCCQWEQYSDSTSIRQRQSGKCALSTYAVWYNYIEYMVTSLVHIYLMWNLETTDINHSGSEWIYMYLFKIR